MNLSNTIVILVLLSSTLLVLSRAQTLKLVAPSHVSSYKSIVTMQETNLYACMDITFTNDGDFDATHWSAYVGVSDFKSITSLYDASSINLDADGWTKSLEFGEAWSAYYNGDVLIGESAVLGVCGAKKSGTWVSDMTIYAEILFVFDTDVPSVSPLQYTENQEDQYYDEINECLPEWGDDIPRYNVISESLISGSVRFGGSIAIEGNASLQYLYDPIGSEDCYSCTDGGLDDACLVVGGSVQDWDSGDGLCRGFYQGDPEIVSDVLNTVDDACPAVTGEIPLDFASIQDTLATVSQELSEIRSNGHTGYYNDDGNWLKFWLLEDQIEDKAVFHIPGNLLNTNGMQMEVLDEDLLDIPEVIIFNVAGDTVVFQAIGMSYFEDYKTKIIWNLYEAENVYLNAAVMYGTILAPHANVLSIAGTQLSGNLYCKTLEAWETQFYPVEWDGTTRGCFSCIDEYFGSSCDECDCAFNEDCADTVDGDGTCTCMEGWNDACDACDDNVFGAMCNNTCSDTCIDRGICSDGVNGDGLCTDCEGYWDGDQCGVCVEGRWGEEACENECTDTCMLRGECGWMDGICFNCDEGWGGDQCDVCDNGHYGNDCENACVETCALYGLCSSGFDGNGECLSCNTNFTGDNCEFCDGNMWGDDCAEDCSDTCLERGTCDVGPTGTGLCSDCEGQYGGDQCETCEDSWYGEECTDQCSQSCQDNGECSDGVEGFGCIRCYGDLSLKEGECISETSAADKVMVSLTVIFLVLLLFVV